MTSVENAMLFWLSKTELNGKFQLASCAFVHARTAILLVTRHLSLVALFFLLPVGCRQQMAEQPRVDPLEASAFFADGRSARPLVTGTVARGHLNDDVHLFTGREPGEGGATGPALRAESRTAAESGRTTSDPAYATTFPFAITDKVMARGQQRYMIFCVVCHGPLGDGDGRIVERGYTRPPSLRSDRSRGMERRGKDVSLKDAPAGYLFDVITNGFGAMPDYAAQVPVEDRWAIIAYIRALQSADLPPASKASGE